MLSKAMRDVGEEERELLIGTRNEPDGVSVEVRDSGPGFAPETLERVFEAFYTTKPDGLGMALSICRSIIEAHGGRLWASLLWVKLGNTRREQMTSALPLTTDIDKALARRTDKRSGD